MDHGGEGEGFSLRGEFGSLAVEFERHRFYFIVCPGWFTLQAGRWILYSEQVRDHYANPRNVGSVAEFSGKALVKSDFDSDTVLISLRVEDGVIADVKFKCMGCAVAIACSSMATEMVLGTPVDKAYKITEQAVADALGGIPEYKMRCSNLAPAAIRQAIDDWRAKTQRP
jgi:nitrogen fixation protein NifU and related proteins